jgi:sn-glycerol 3-phosphate transport system ATP-binding protein
MAPIRLADVRKTYAGGVDAVKGVSLDIADGALCVLVGPSGCGKSTLLRMIAGLESITGGEVAIGGRVVNEIEPAERDIAMVFQNYALYPHMSVYDNLAYGLRNRGTPKAEIDRRVGEAATLLQIEPFLKRRPRELSGGQRQRVAMGRAIVREPQAFLFDEPLSNLDAKLRNQMRIEIRQLQRRLATTSVYVTHDQLEAMTLADLLVVMNKGEVEQAGKPLDIYDKPATVFVAGFIGAPAMNLVPATANGATVAAAGGKLRVAAPAWLGRRQVLLGIRPEHLHPGRAPVGCLSLEFRLEALEPVGAETYLHGRLADHAIIARTGGKAAMAPGAAVTVHARAQDLHWFDPATGKRLEPPVRPAAKSAAPRRSKR